MHKYFFYFLTLIVSMDSFTDFDMLSSEDVLSTPLPLPYDEKIIDSSELDKFINQSINNDKQPVVIFGGNWCPDCRILAGTLAMPTIKKFLQRYYRIIHIDIGRYDRNMELMNHLNIEPKKGVPRVVILDFKKNIVNSSTSSEWTTARDRKEQEIYDYFQKFVSDN
ncbi:MAG: thioredoxin family protein [SAR86 cluster bacterium]|uniref:Thioredoxin family protein n=1 Tax=SAR86 cluster bacterium TaxID=2030880 RepID=A0A937JHX9_9GAMM|nr:thioredoxin family protein [SAR86 cluster bacterium]